jgi:hypothetical protein
MSVCETFGSVAGERRTIDVERILVRWVGDVTKGAATRAYRDKSSDVRLCGGHVRARQVRGAVTTVEAAG